MTPNDSKLAIDASADWPIDGLERLGCCPLCGRVERELVHDGLSDRIFFCAPGRWTLYRCRSCDCDYLDPRPTPTTMALAYGRYYTHEQPEALPVSGGRLLASIKSAIINDWLNSRYGIRRRPSFPLARLLGCVDLESGIKFARRVRHLPPPPEAGRLLDIGCGSGGFVALAASLGWASEGIDPDPVAVSAGRSAGLALVARGFPETGFPDGRFDVITMNHVIEHLHDPRAALAEAWRLLTPGGRLWLATPNPHSPGHRHFGPFWRGLEPPRHLVLFSLAALRDYCLQAGFERTETPRNAMTATWYFKTSLAVQRGVEGALPLPIGLRLAALAANVRSLFFPAENEELVLVAIKPKSVFR